MAGTKNCNFTESSLNGCLCILGLGTNLVTGENLRKTIAMIVESIGEVVLCSSVYQTEPWGFQSENEF
jgi:2-amino-4-hydroxy-6-hydroxymethyldihydropteridine diphosphokinase